MIQREHHRRKSPNQFGDTLPLRTGRRGFLCLPIPSRISRTFFLKVAASRQGNPRSTRKTWSSRWRLSNGIRFECARRNCPSCYSLGVMPFAKYQEDAIAAALQSKIKAACPACQQLSKRQWLGNVVMFPFYQPVLPPPMPLSEMGRYKPAITGDPVNLFGNSGFRVAIRAYAADGSVGC